MPALRTPSATGWRISCRSSRPAGSAAFAREAINGLAEQDKVRVHAYRLDGRIIASLIVLVEAGVAYTWKTAYAEDLAQFSPGTLLMMDATRAHLDDPNIELTDSCSTPDHPVMARMFAEREPMGTLVIALTQAADRQARQAAAQISLYSETRAFARRLRDRVLRLVRR